MKKIIAALAVSFTLFSTQVMAQDECATPRQVMAKAAQDNPDIADQFKLSEMNSAATAVFLDNMGGTFGEEFVKGASDVWIVKAKGTDSVFVFLVDAHGCILRGGSMDSTTFKLMLTK